MMTILAALLNPLAPNPMVAFLSDLAPAFEGRVKLLAVVSPQKGTQLETVDRKQSMLLEANLLGSPVSGLYVPPEPAWAETSSQATERVRNETQDLLADSTGPLQSKDIAVSTEVISSFNQAQAILDVAARDQVDLIALACPNRSRLRNLLGRDVSSAVVKAHIAPVLLVG